MNYISEGVKVGRLVIVGTIGIIAAVVAAVSMMIFLSVSWVVGLPIVIKVGDQQRKYRWFRRV